MIFDIAPKILEQIEEYANFQELTLTDKQKEKVTKKIGEHVIQLLQDTSIVEYYMESIDE